MHKEDIERCGMISAFYRLKEVYGSREITMDDLRDIQVSGIVSFENCGISRTNRECLLCEIRFDRLIALIGKLTAAPFDSPESLKKQIENSGILLSAQSGGSDGLIVFTDEAAHIELIAQVDSEGRVSVEAGDIDAVTSFQLFLRVQDKATLR